MSTTHYSPSASAGDTERYIRCKEDERGVAITCDVPGGPGAFSVRARALTQNTTREVEARLQYHALHDALTGLPNRAMILGRLQELLDSRYPRYERSALLLLDINLSLIHI